MFSERLKSLRRASKMKQSELAQKLSLSQQTISLYEANKRHPDLETHQASQYFKQGIYSFFKPGRAFPGADGNTGDAIGRS